MNNHTNAHTSSQNDSNTQRKIRGLQDLGSDSVKSHVGNYAATLHDLKIDISTGTIVVCRKQDGFTWIDKAGGPNVYLPRNVTVAW